MATIAIRLDPDTRRKLALLAKATGRTRSSLVAEAVQRFVNEGFQQVVAEVGQRPVQTGGISVEIDDEADGTEALNRWNIIV